MQPARTHLDWDAGLHDQLAYKRCGPRGYNLKYIENLHTHLKMLLPILATAAAAAFAAVATALPTSPSHVVHEKRSGSSSWSPMQDAKPDGRITLPVRIGLTESNLHRGDEILMEVSDPASKKYGKHLTAEEVMRYPSLARIAELILE